MDSFQRFAPQARFQPRAVADVASALDQEINVVSVIYRDNTLDKKSNVLKIEL